ncbi:hypothetical protein CAI21_09680 [Alkalilimnicola ehrlichii]|uniref:ADP-ribosylglycohydrolase n=1 Tax=Alkalilimnicola ehrlichii TaxID=351052 RepID=A0A3E0WY67_9GAMM|nr:ADP-ribosylglycohydrolase family protein [Alkalilimnicola ehrlichii]RFA29332.1 hypothetical protein CAI21_09680 [Alkalilimnicola ehrlichii]RFA36847.1 hypothetical protein CAL65_10015 [Alkalilimnicola ehrlichii]
MLGAIVGDIVGSVPQPEPALPSSGPLFSAASQVTGHTIATIAVAESLLSGRDGVDLLHEYYARYPEVVYEPAFSDWAKQRHRLPYRGDATTAAARVSPVAYVYEQLRPVLTEAERCAVLTHRQPNAWRLAQALAGCIYLLRRGARCDDVVNLARFGFGCDLTTPMAERSVHLELHGGRVAIALRVLLDSSNFIDALEKARAYRGADSALLSMTGALAEAAYGVPADIVAEVEQRLPPSLAKVVQAFRRVYEGEQRIDAINGYSMAC